MSVLFSDLKIPKMCVMCDLRDPEMGGNCVLMPGIYYDTYNEQFEHCPIKYLERVYGAREIKEITIQGIWIK